MDSSPEWWLQLETVQPAAFRPCSSFIAGPVFLLQAISSRSPRASSGVGLPRNSYWNLSCLLQTYRHSVADRSNALLSFGQSVQVEKKKAGDHHVTTHFPPIAHHPFSEVHNSVSGILE